MGQQIDLLIINAKVYDGNGGEPYEGDIAVVRGRIVSISTPPARHRENALKIIDAAGLSAAPGFIDTHAHSEFTLLADSRAEGKVLQGVTTEINGNCGLSGAPLYGDALMQREKDLRELEIEERWSTLGEYLELIESRRPAINMATLVGHGNVRASVVGYDSRRPTGSEAERMCVLVRKAVGEGAIGLSTGLIYPPGLYAETEELITLSRCIGDLIYATHMRSEGDALVESVEETLRIGREAGIAVHISHLKTGGRQNWEKAERVIAAIEEARGEGVRITADRYPYTAASTDLDAVLPAWTYAGGAGEELRRLKDEQTRRDIEREVLSAHPLEDYWESITISSLAREENRWMEGKTLASIAQELGRRPVEFLLDILIEEDLRIGAIFHSMNEENLRRFLSLPYVMIGSDSSARSVGGRTERGKPHPRGFGTFPRFLGRYARDMALMSLAEAIRKVTMLPAGTFGLGNRGLIREGFAADLVIFDEEGIRDRASFEEPFLKPEGIAYVLVNGQPAVWGGALTGVMAGKVLRHGK